MSASGIFKHESETYREAQGIHIPFQCSQDHKSSRLMTKERHVQNRPCQFLNLSFFVAPIQLTFLTKKRGDRGSGHLVVYIRQYIIVDSCNAHIDIPSYGVKDRGNSQSQEKGERVSRPTRVLFWLRASCQRQRQVLLRHNHGVFLMILG